MGPPSGWEAVGWERRRRPVWGEGVAGHDEAARPQVTPGAGITHFCQEAFATVACPPTIIHWGHALRSGPFLAVGGFLAAMIASVTGMKYVVGLSLEAGIEKSRVQNFLDGFVVCFSGVCACVC